MKNDNRSTTEQFDIKYLFGLFYDHKFFYAGALILAMAIAYIVNDFSKEIYVVDTSVIINEEGSSFQEATSNLLQGIGMGAPNKNYANELLTLNSKPLIKETLKKLDFDVSYYYYKKFKSVELYKSAPFVVLMDKDHPQPLETEFHLRINDNGTFTLSVSKENAVIYSFLSDKVVQRLPEFEIEGIGEFGKTLKSDHYSFRIILNERYNFDDYNTNHFSFKIHNVSTLAGAYAGRLVVESVDMESSVAQISLRSAAPGKEVDFLNALTETYLERELKRKIFISDQTINYIDNQLNVVKDSLRLAEEKLQNFRSSNKVVDISMQSGRVYDEIQDLEKEKADLTVNLKYYDYISEYFEKNQEYSDLITPSGMGIDDPLLNNMIEELITLNSEKVGFIENNQEKSPYLRKINIRIDNLRNMIMENISYVKQTTKLAVQDINSRLNQLNSEIRKLPKAQRELFGIERKFNLNDAIYTFLLQRRAEAEIAKATYLSDAEILEPASAHGPVSPNKQMNYIFALLVGLLIPTGIIRLRDILRNTFASRHEIENLSLLPILGRVYRNNKKMEPVVNNFPKSHIAESFRMLRTNLNYFISDPDKSNIIVVTSLVGQEGKSFVSLNLAISLASAHKKTILLGFDLRKPKLYERMNIVEKEGLSAYLSKQANLDDIIQSTNVPNLDAIYAGRIPPNPSELITSSRLNSLLENLKENYEFIIIDTAPIGLVSETFDLIEVADLKLMVVRLNHTPKKDLLALIEEMKNKNLMNTSIVINDVKLLKKSKYGYGYYEDNYTNKTKSP